MLYPNFDCICSSAICPNLLFSVHIVSLHIEQSLNFKHSPFIHQTASPETNIRYLLADIVPLSSPDTFYISSVYLSLLFLHVLGERRNTAYSCSAS